LEKAAALSSRPDPLPNSAPARTGLAAGLVQTALEIRCSSPTRDIGDQRFRAREMATPGMRAKLQILLRVVAASGETA
jgi:hypothetical protein